MATNTDVTPLSENVYASKFSMSDKNWRQVVYDHRLLIRKHCTTVLFSMEDAHYWRFRLQEYLIDKYTYPDDAVWIVDFVNNFQQIDVDGGVLEVLVPDLTYLEKLRTAMDQNTTTY